MVAFSPYLRPYFAIVVFVLVLLPLTAKGSILLSVPFTPQAPFGNWAKPYQDFCEEASAVMAAHWIWKVPLAPLLADREMNIIRQYEELVYHRSKDTSASEVADILTTLYGFLNVHTKELSGTQEIKNELKSGKILIVPVAGRMLGNPNFVPPGPFYHMLVIKGFDDAKDIFITNDPGTKRGNSFSYQQGTLFNAIHDWNNGDVMRGKKTVVIVGR